MLQIVETVLIPRQRGIKTPNTQQGVVVSPDRLLVVGREVSMLVVLPPLVCHSKDRWC